MRLADLEGLSAVGHRPGASALSLVASGTLGLTVVQATAALEVALGVCVGLAGAALLRRRTSVTGAWLGGLLCGTFAVHLAAGYLANLAFVPPFLAAITLLDEDRRRATVLAAIALGAGGLAHPLFFVLGAVVLLVTAAGALRSRPAEARRLAGTAVGAGAIVGAGLLTLVAGPRPPEVDTSKDAFLRRAGLGGELRSAYRDRFVQRWERYVQWLSVPLALAGLSGATGTAGRILRTWLWVTIGGVALALITGWIPPDRFVTVGFAVPLLAALGLERIRVGLGRRRVLGWLLVTGLTLLMLAGSAIAWSRQEPFLTDAEVRTATIAGGLARGPLAFAVDDDDGEVTFLASRAGNVIRASVPPERIRDIVVVVPHRDGSDPVRAALEELTAADVLALESREGRPAPLIVLAPFFGSASVPPTAIEISPGQPLDEPQGMLSSSSPAGIGWASVATLALLWVVGFGWTRIGLADRLTAAAAAPAIGCAALILVAVVLDQVGVRVGTTSGALAVSALAGGGGYLARFVLQRRSGAGASPQIEQEPAE